jgi:putative inorganic carbon (HCO3(-)) transporter
MDWLIAIALVAPAVGLASRRSTWLIDYAVILFVVNRGLRRVVDYYINGAFNPLSPISLTPLVIALLMGWVIVTHRKFLPRYAQVIGGLFLTAYALAGAIGFFKTQLAVLYALAEVLAPLFLMLYAILLNPKMEVRDRWIRAFSWGAVLVSAYGWYQYVTIPPWDKFWLLATDMVGYMGQPNPYEMSVFSTMGERGVVGTYLGYSVVPMMVSKKWRTSLGWIAVVLVFSAMLLTLTRGSLIIAAVSTLFFVVVNRGANRKQVIIGVIILSVAGYYGISKIPNSERILERYETLDEMTEDGSYIARTAIMQASVGQVLVNPLGLGLGASGLATRVNTGNVKSKAEVVDAGYLDILLNFGIPGTILMLVALWKVWKQLSFRFRSPSYKTEHVLLARALMASLLVTCFIGNLLTQFSVLWLAMGTGLAIRAAGPMARRAETGNLNRSHAEMAEGKPEGAGRRGPGALLSAGYEAAREELARQADPPSPGAGLRRDEGSAKLR